MNKKIVVIVCVIIVIFLLVVSVVFFKDKKKREDRNYELLQVSEYTYFPLEVDGKYGVIKRDGNIVINPEFDEVQIPNQDRGIFILKQGNDYLVMNERNQKIFTNFAEVTAIHGKNAQDEDVYNTTVLKYKENGKFGIVDFDENKVSEAEYDQVEALMDKEGEILIKKNDKYGVINVKGVELVHPDYDYIKGDGYTDSNGYKDAGYIVGIKTLSGINYGYLDKNEKEVLKKEQESIYRVTEINSLDTYLVASKNGRFAIFKNNENLTDYKYIDIYYNPETQDFTVQKNKSFGLIDLNGKVIVPEQYDELQVVGIYVKTSKNGENFIFDLNGNLVENPKFTSLTKTSTERFYITIDENNKYGIADLDKNIVIENKYDYIDEIESTGLLIATVNDDITIYSGSATEIFSVNNAKLSIIGEYIQVITAKESYYLTVNGKKVDNKTVYIDNMIYASKSNKKWGFVDLKDNVIVDYKYDEVTEINEYGFAGIKKNGKWGVINKNGEVILEPTYQSDVINPTFIGIYYKDGNVVRNSINE